MPSQNERKTLWLREKKIRIFFSPGRREGPETGGRGPEKRGFRDARGRRRKKSGKNRRKRLAVSILDRKDRAGGKRAERGAGAAQVLRKGYARAVLCGRGGGKATRGGTGRGKQQMGRMGVY